MGYGRSQRRKESQEKEKRERSNQRKIADQKLIPSKSNETSAAAKTKWPRLSEKQKKWLELSWKIVVGFGVVLAIWQGGVSFYDKYLKSNKAKYDEQNIVDQGDLRSGKVSEHLQDEVTYDNKKTFDYDEKNYKFPPVIGIHIPGLSKMGDLNFKLGGNTVGINVRDLYQGVNLTDRGILLAKCANVEILSQAKGDRLYVSCKFRELKSGDLMGDMRFNHWEVYNGKFLNYRYTDKQFEITDHQGYITFSISYHDGKRNPFVTLGGYFIQGTSVLVINGGQSGFHCFDDRNPKWKQLAEAEIDSIPSVFNAPHTK